MSDFYVGYYFEICLEHRRSEEVYLNPACICFSRSELSIGVGGMRDSSGFPLNGLAAQVSLPIFDTSRAHSELADANIAQAQIPNRSDAPSDSAESGACLGYNMSIMFLTDVQLFGEIYAQAIRR